MSVRIASEMCDELWAGLGEVTVQVHSHAKHYKNEQKTRITAVFKAQPLAKWSLRFGTLCSKQNGIMLGAN